MLRLTKQKSTLQITMIKEQVHSSDECPSNKTIHDVLNARLEGGNSRDKALTKRAAKISTKWKETVYKL